MKATSRRVVRLTIRTSGDIPPDVHGEAWGDVDGPPVDVDIAVAADAVAAEVVRLVVQERSALSAPSPGDDNGWCLVHPVRGPISPETRLGDLQGLLDGDVLHLLPRAEADLTPPVDDVAERTRVVVGADAAPVGRLSGTLLCLALPVTGAFVVVAAEGPGLVPAVSALIATIACLVAMRTRQELLESAGAVAVVAGAVSAGLIAAELDRAPDVVALAAGVGALGAALVPAVTSHRRWWRPLAVGLTGIVMLLSVHVLTLILGLDDARGVTVVALAVIALCQASTAVSLTTSGLGALDDRVARGQAVDEAHVGAAVRRARDDLAAILLVVAGSASVLAVPLASAGRVAALLSFALATIVGARARTLVATWHVVPLVVGGGIAAGATLFMLVGVDGPRSVPVLVLALCVLLGGATLSAERGVRPVTASRLRRAIAVGETAALVGVPVLVAGVFDLYRWVWGKF